MPMIRGFSPIPSMGSGIQGTGQVLPLDRKAGKQRHTPKEHQQDRNRGRQEKWGHSAFTTLPSEAVPVDASTIPALTGSPPPGSTPRRRKVGPAIPSAATVAG